MTLWLLSVGCGALLGEGDNVQTVDNNQGADDTAFWGVDDQLAPAIEHEPLASPQSASDYITVEAGVVDDVAVLAVKVYYRRQVDGSFKSHSMATSGPDAYYALLEPADMGSAGMHYYLEAVDTSGNLAYAPEDAPDAFYKFDLVD